MKNPRRYLTSTILLAFLGLGGWTTVAVADEAADGKALFLAKKCNLCHSITSQNIEKMSKLKGKELSTIASEIPDVDWLKGWLSQHELKDGKKHKKKFKGTDEELATLVNWIMTLKS